MITLSSRGQAGGIGVVAQLVERFVRNEKVTGSTPASSTSFFGVFLQFFRMPMLTSSPRFKPGDSSYRFAVGEVLVSKRLPRIRV